MSEKTKNEPRISRISMFNIDTVTCRYPGCETVDSTRFICERHTHLIRNAEALLYSCKRFLEFVDTAGSEITVAEVEFARAATLQAEGRTSDGREAV